MGDQAEVVIAGAGPVGLMLSTELALAEVRVVVLERATEFDTRLRAPGITARTIEALDRRDLLDELIATVSAIVEPELAELMTGRGPDGAPPDALPIRPGVLERLLEQRARALGVDVRHGVQVLTLDQDDDGVRLVAQDRAGRTETIRGDYAVGCDGGRSTVRKAAGIDFPGEDSRVTGYQAVVAVDDPDRLGRGDPDRLSRQWHRTEHGVVGFALAPSRVVTIEFDGPPVDRTAPVSLPEVQASLRRTSGTDVTLSDPQSLTRFTGTCRLAEDYRLGRVLLAGDAAHVHPPFGGQGLNLGVQDAVNLGWKLALVVRGQAPDRLLDTYQHERRPVAARALRNSQAAVAILRPGAANTPVYELFSDELMQLPEVKRKLRALHSMTDLRYPGNDPHPLVGTTITDAQLTTCHGSTRLNCLHHTGRGVLLDLADDPSLCAAARPWAERITTVTATSPDFPDLDAVLLRPDGYVAWAAPEAAGGASNPAGFAAAARSWFGSAQTAPWPETPWPGTTTPVS